MISARLKQLLDDHRVVHTVVQHDPAFTAQELAAQMHVPGREFVKVVVVKLDRQPALAAVPAHRLVDLKALARLAKVKKCSLASEAELQELFPDCEVGAMPPFGKLYQMTTFMDREVADNQTIVVNAGTHGEAIRLGFADLDRLANPRLGSFTVPPRVEVAARKRAEKARKAAKAKRKKKARPRKKPARKKKVKTRKRAKAKKRVARKTKKSSKRKSTRKSK
jgi:Ala-tRNA(Pro) deacylase